MIYAISMFMNIYVVDHQAACGFCLPGNLNWFGRPRQTYERFICFNFVLLMLFTRTPKPSLISISVPKTTKNGKLSSQEGILE
jgi:hypothetical protein